LLAVEVHSGDAVIALTGCLRERQWSPVEFAGRLY
jgi:hypothetical protein